MNQITINKITQKYIKFILYYQELIYKPNKIPILKINIILDMKHNTHIHFFKRKDKHDISTQILQQVNGKNNKIIIDNCVYMYKDKHSLYYTVFIDKPIDVDKSNIKYLFYILENFEDKNDIKQTIVDNYINNNIYLEDNNEKKINIQHFI